MYTHLWKNWFFWIIDVLFITCIHDLNMNSFVFLWDSVILVLKVFRLATFIVFVLNFLFEWLFKCSNWEMKFLLFFFYVYFFKTLIHSLFYWFSGCVKWAYGRFKVYSVGNDFMWLLILAYTWKIKFSYFLSVGLDTVHLKSQFIDQNLHKQFSFLPNPRISKPNSFQLHSMFSSDRPRN